MDEDRPDELAELVQLRAELADLRRRHDELLARLDAIAHQPSTPRADVAPRIGRRLMLGGAAAAAAGAALAVGGASRPAAAAVVLPIENGQRNAITKQTTLANAGTAAPGPTGDGVDLDDSDVLFVIDNTGSTRDGASAVQAMGRTRAIVALTSVGGTVIDAHAGAADGIGVAAVATGPAGVGVLASGSAYGIRAGGGSIAGDFVGADYGITVGAARPIVFTFGHGRVGPPVTTSAIGETAFDLAGNLYLCVAAGTPGEWRRLAGPDTAGAMHLLTEPRRVYDSRPNNAPVGPSNGGPKGPISDGEVRIVDCTANGSPVPADATGLLFNLAVTSTNAAGFLTAWGSGGQPLASSMNWSQANVTLSNSVTIGAASNATFQLFCGGGGLAHVIVDVAGYYR